MSAYDTRGRLVSVNLSELNDGLWMLSDLEAGMYLLKVDDGYTTVTRAFVVIKS